MAWNEEFKNGLGGWNYNTGSGWGNGNEKQTYTSSANNVYIEPSNNQLVLTLRKESNGTITSGRIYSKYSQQYGRVDIRAKLSNKQPGVFPALWLVGEPDTDWPSCGELDLVEWFGQDYTGWSPAAHVWTNGVYDPAMDQGGYLDGVAINSWNIYSVEWCADHAIFYVNDVVKYVVTKRQYEALYGPGFTLDRPQKAVLSLAANGNHTWMPKLDPAFVQDRFYVDYVRFS